MIHEKLLVGIARYWSRLGERGVVMARELVGGCRGCKGGAVWGGGNEASHTRWLQPTDDPARWPLPTN